MADSKLAGAFLQISMRGMPELESSMRGIRGMFAGNIGAMQASVDKSMASIHAAFSSGMKGAATGAADSLSGLQDSFGGIIKMSAGMNASFNALTRSLAGIGSPTQNMVAALAGARAAFNGGVSASHGLGRSVSGLAGVFRGGVTAMAGVSEAALLAGRSVAWAGDAVLRGGFKQGFDNARTAAGMASLSFTGFRQTLGGVVSMSAGMSASMRGLTATAAGLGRSLAGIGSPTQNMMTVLAGARAAFDGAGTTARGFGRSIIGLTGVLQGGIGAFGALTGATFIASRSILAAGTSVMYAGFKRGFSAASVAARAFASAGSAAMRAFSASVRGAVSAVQSASSSMARSFGNILSHIHPVRLALAGFAATAAGAFFSIKSAASAESTEASFKTMLGGGEQGAAKAKGLMRNVNQFAADTPYELPELNDATRKLLAFGASEKTVMGDLKMMGDVASGIQAPIGEIAEIYGKARVQGRLFAEDINQLTGRGIPIIGELAKQFGVSEGEVKKLVEKGKVGFPELEKAFQDMTAAGGKFHGMMDEQSKTAGGLWSTLTDNIKSVARDLGTAMLPAVKEVMASFIAMTGDASNWLDPIKVKIGDVSQALASKLPEILDWFKQAWTYEKAWLQTLWSAFSAVGRIVGSVGSALQGIMPSIKGVGGGFLKAMDSARFFFDNLETYLKLGWEHVRLFAENSGERVEVFFVNVGTSLKWFGSQWKNIFQTILDFTRTVIENMGQNLGQFWQAMRDWMSGKGFSFQWQGLLDGFQSSIDKMPGMMTAIIRETTPEIDRLYRQLEEADAKHRKQKQYGGGLSNALPPGYEPGGPAANAAKEASKRDSEDGKFGRYGLVEFARHLQDGANQKASEAEARDKEKVKEAKEQTKQLKEINGKADRKPSGILVEP